MMRGHPPASPYGSTLDLHARKFAPLPAFPIARCLPMWLPPQPPAQRKGARNPQEVHCAVVPAAAARLWPGPRGTWFIPPSTLITAPENSSSPNDVARPCPYRRIQTSLYRILDLYMALIQLHSVPHCLRLHNRTRCASKTVISYHFAALI